METTPQSEDTSEILFSELARILAGGVFRAHNRQRFLPFAGDDPAAQKSAERRKESLAISDKSRLSVHAG